MKGPRSQSDASPGRWREQQWVEHALSELARHGPEGLTLESLCQSAGRTRGSLYHHFPDHEALLLAVIRYWRERDTEAIIRTIRDERLGGAKGAARLNDLATAVDFDVEVGIRRLAASRPNLAHAVAEVDRRRIAFLAELRIEAGAAKKDAQALAELEYAAFVGVQHLSSLFTPARLRELYRHLETLFAR